MGLIMEYDHGQTPLDENEIEGLRHSHVTTRGELDQMEQLNIEKAVRWAFEEKFRKNTILSAGFIKSLHKLMLGEVWIWAGEYRKSEKNLGVDWTRIGPDLKVLLDDTNYWIVNRTFDPDEIAIRFKHRLVSIHCFPNGNGRHSRLMADILIRAVFQRHWFSWGSSDSVSPHKTRKKYINCLKEADKGNIKPLLDFARS
jgi:Fic-DOC domain mobile mystery protein B